VEDGERLQKVLARAGLGSRRACEDLIRSGRVRVNGRVAELGGRIDPSTATVEVDGVAMALDPDLVYLALNKPVGVVSTASDPERRRTVLDLVPPQPRVFPVGRLDIDTSGLLLLTNDGDFANRITHPRYEIPKTYVAQVQGSVGERLVARIGRGVDLDDGPVTVDRVRVVGRQGDRTLVELVVHEGRKRMVRRLFDEVGHPVRSLVRTAIGPLRLGRLHAGGIRKVEPADVRALLRLAAGAEPWVGSG